MANVNKFLVENDFHKDHISQIICLYLQQYKYIELTRKDQINGLRRSIPYLGPDRIDGKTVEAITTSSLLL